MKELLINAIEKLLSIESECTFSILSDLDADQLTLTQINYLKRIKALKATTISELSEAMAVSKPTVTESVKKLQKNGYISKKKCEVDGRKYYIELTDKGTKLANYEKLSIIKLVDRMTNQLTQEEILIFINVLKDID